MNAQTNIKRKVESAFAAYLGTVTGLAGLEIVPAHQAEVEAFPICIVHCQNCPGESDLVPAVNEYEAELVIQLITNADDTSDQELPSVTPSVPLSDPRLAVVVTAMRDITAIKTALNLAAGVTDTDDDTRTVGTFHVKRVFEKDQSEGIQGRNFIDSLEYTVHVCDFDADGD